MGLVTSPTVEKIEFHKSKMADRRHFENHKLPYLCNRETDFDEIWHVDAYWPTTAN